MKKLQLLRRESRHQQRMRKFLKRRPDFRRQMRETFGKDWEDSIHKNRKRLIRENPKSSVCDWSFRKRLAYNFRKYS